MINNIIERLKLISLFQEFKESDEDLKLIADIITIRTYKKHELILKEGGIGQEMFILNKGIVHVDRKTLENDTYRIVTISADMNIFFGELALMDNGKCSASVVAGDECELFVISQNDFISFGNKYPRLGLSITREIAKKITLDLRKANNDIIILFEALVGELETPEI